MFDPKTLLDQFLGGRGADGRRAGPSRDMMGGLAAGGLAGLLIGTKGGRKLAKGALKVGGTAVLAGLAYKAFNNWQTSKQQGGAAPSPGNRPAADPAGTPFLPADDQGRDDLSFGVLRAMIAAAKSDGHVDAVEQQRIFAKLDEAGVDVEAKAFVVDELRRPLDIDAVVSSAKSPEAAAELYMASVLTIDPDDPAEQAYLQMLASRLKLDPGLKSAIEAEARGLEAGA
jgi:uncharacterized membrane protein YebE (DUF533 family)